MILNTFDTALRQAKSALANAESNIVSVRQNLAVLAGDCTAARINDSVMDLANAEGQVLILTEIVDILEQNPEAILDFLIQSLSSSVDDTWSGRGNEINRAQHEGRTIAVRRLHHWLEVFK